MTDTPEEPDLTLALVRHLLDALQLAGQDARGHAALTASAAKVVSHGAHPPALRTLDHARSCAIRSAALVGQRAALVHRLVPFLPEDVLLQLCDEYTGGLDMNCAGGRALLGLRRYADEIRTRRAND